MSKYSLILSIDVMFTSNSDTALTNQLNVPDTYKNKNNVVQALFDIIYIKLNKLTFKDVDIERPYKFIVNRVYPYL